MREGMSSGTSATHEIVYKRQSVAGGGGLLKLGYGK